MSHDFPHRLISSITLVLAVCAGMVTLTALNGCHPAAHPDHAEDSGQSPVTTAAHTDHVAAPPLSPMAALGKMLFFEPRLSASGQMSCASCHSPQHAFGPANALSVQMGGKDGHLQGLRAVPNLTYSKETPFFSIGATDEASEEANPGGSSSITEALSQDGIHLATQQPLTKQASQIKQAHQAASPSDQVPEGGLFWDGRADSLEAQALGPLMNPLEMANTSKAVLVRTLKQLPYIKQIEQFAGPDIMQNDDRFLEEVLFLIGRYQTEERAFAPYSSKYDAYLAGKATLTAPEMRGLKLFDDPNKGNCAACHLDQPRPNGHPPMFTDYEFEALGVPRNPGISANQDAHFYDLGICGPSRHDVYAQQAANCGLFKTPSLRNVAVRQAYFHNGVYHNLRDVLNFYVNRDIHPELVYAKLPNGTIHKFDDLPQKYQGNIDYHDAPFNRKVGDAPALTDAEISDVIAFLNTLTDGYKPAH